MRKSLIIPLAATAILVGAGSTVCQAVQLKWAIVGSDAPYLNEVVQKFQKKTGNVVKIEYCSDTRALTDTLLDSPPDIITMNPSQMAEYVEMGIFSNMAKYVGADKRFLSDFIPSLLQSYSNGKAIYALPWNAQITAMRYNKDLFKKSGLKEPSATWRYTAEYYQAMKKLTKDTNRDGAFDQHGLVGIPIADFMPVVYSFGAKIVSDNGKKFMFQGKEAVSALDFIKKLHKEGLARTWDWQQGNNQQFPFLDGKVGTVITSGRMMSNDVKFKLGMTVPPQGPGGRFTSVEASGAAVFNNSKKKKQAVDFIKYLTSSETQILMYNKGGVIPTSLSAIQSNKLKKGKTSIDESLIRALPKAKSMSANPALRRAWTFNRGLGDYINGEISASDFIANIKERVEEAIANGMW